jgi:hypothetical protein
VECWISGSSNVVKFYSKMLRNVTKNVNKCLRMLTNVARCWIEMLDQNVIKNVQEFSEKCCGMLRNVIKKCWRML